MILFDNHNRPINYLRLAVTDRCNLRCFYCMPEKGIKYLPKKEVLSFEEMERLVALLASMGIQKVRITGGEPFVRNDLMKLLRSIVNIKGITNVHLTTNGILSGPHVPELKQLGISSVNFSLDTLDAERFKTITRRDEFKATIKTLESFIQHQIPIKINTVVMEDKNIEDIIPLIELTRHENIEIRFIEEMPFNGSGSHYTHLHWTHIKIVEYIKEHYPHLIKLTDPQHSTSYNYKVGGYKGSVGVIAAFSRTFCGSCNRIRVTAQGQLKTCLYDGGVLDIKKMMREGRNDEAIQEQLLHAFSNRAKDGFAAEKRNVEPIHESMSTIGG